MSCTSFTLTGITAQCKNFGGGLRKAWVMLAETYAEARKAGKITITDNTITIDAAEIVASKVVVYNLRKNSMSETSTLQTADDAGNSYSTDVTASIIGADADKSKALEDIASAELVVITKDANGVYKVIGDDEFPVEVSALTQQSGTAISDKNGYDVTFNGVSNHLPYFVPATATDMIAALEAL